LDGLKTASDTLAAGALDGHQADHNIITAGQQGIFGDLRPQDMAATVARRQVGGDFIGQARDIPQLGGTDWEAMGAGAVGPVPGGAYARSFDDDKPAPGTESPLHRFMRGQ
jgi:hypothetical protein